MKNKIYTEKEMETLHHSKRKLRTYFTRCAGGMVNRGLRENDPHQTKTGLILFQFLDEFVNSTYKPKDGA